jgi:hypothetical protein
MDADGCAELVTRIVWETLLDRTGCGGYGKAFGEMHPSVTDAASLTAHASDVLRTGRRQALDAETLLLDALPYFSDDHVEMVRAWLEPVPCCETDRTCRAEGDRSVSALLGMRRPRAAREWVAEESSEDGRPAAKVPSEEGAAAASVEPASSTAKVELRLRAWKVQVAEPPVCMASAWGHYMDASGALLKADGYGAIRWRGCGGGGGGTEIGAEVVYPTAMPTPACWRRCSDRYAFQCAESFVSEVTGRQHQLHRVEVYTRLPQVCSAESDSGRSAELRLPQVCTSCVDLRGGSAPLLPAHRTPIGLEFASEAAALLVSLGVFCRVGSGSGGRLQMEREAAGVASVAGREVVRYLFPAEVLLADSAAPLTVELVWCRTPSPPPPLPVTLVTQEVLLMLRPRL